MEDHTDSSPRTQEETSTLMATESKPGWTDEKHCLFLKSMESMFVNQLYKSIDTFGWHSRKNCPSGSKPSKNNLSSVRSSDQFKVFCSGCSSKIDFQRKGHGVDEEEESKVPSVRNSQLHETRKHQASRERVPKNQRPGNNLTPPLLDSVGSNTEVMDQNFIDETFEEELSATGMHNTKRTRARTSSDIASSTDQVVPICNNVRRDNAREDHVRVPPKD